MSSMATPFTKFYAREATEHAPPDGSFYLYTGSEGADLHKMRRDAIVAYANCLQTPFRTVGKSRAP